MRTEAQKKEYQKQYREDNKDKIKEYCKNNKEKILTKKEDI